MVNRLEQAVELIDAVGPDVGAVLADTLPHEHRGGRAQLGAGPGRRAVSGHVQVSDSNRFQPGAGHLDWPALLGTLDAVGYDGYLALECRLTRRARPTPCAAVPRFLRRHDLTVRR